MYLEKVFQIYMVLASIKKHIIFDTMCAKDQTLITGLIKETQRKYSKSSFDV